MGTIISTAEAAVASTDGVIIITACTAENPQYLVGDSVVRATPFVQFIIVIVRLSLIIF